MTFDEVLQAVDLLSEEERHQLRQYLDKLSIGIAHTIEERIRQMDAAAAAIREDLTPSQLAEMTAAMNEEYIEPWNESEWNN